MFFFTWTRSGRPVFAHWKKRGLSCTSGSTSGGIRMRSTMTTIVFTPSTAWNIKTSDTISLEGAIQSWKLEDYIWLMITGALTSVFENPLTTSSVACWSFGSTNETNSITKSTMFTTETIVTSKKIFTRIFKWTCSIKPQLGIVNGLKNRMTNTSQKSSGWPCSVAFKQDPPRVSKHQPQALSVLHSEQVACAEQVVSFVLF